MTALTIFISLLKYHVYFSLLLLLLLA